MGLEVFVSSCEILSIGWCEPGKGTQLGVVCHAPKSRTVVSSLVFCIMPKGEMPKVLRHACNNMDGPVTYLT